MKILVWTVSIILGLIVAALAFVYLSPDYDVYFVRSESMKPAINIGDMMIAGPTDAGGGIAPGVIVTYELGNNLITPRVLYIDGATLIPKGDANVDPDPQPVQVSQVRSRYLFKIPYVGYLAGFMQTRLGWLLIIILPAIVLAGFMVKGIIKEKTKNEHRVNNVVKTDMSVNTTVKINSPLKAKLSEALQDYSFSEKRVVDGKVKHKNHLTRKT